jgi:hypothetical protein
METLVADLQSLARRRVLLLAIFMVAVLLPAFLWTQGRPLVCECGYVLLWSGEVWGAENSQHLLDFYTITHLEHGLLYFLLLYALLRKYSFKVAFIVATAIAVGWEMIENSSFIISRYQESTASMGYEGDTIINSVADVVAAQVGFLIARAVGWRYTIAVFVLTEVLLLLLIRDNLLINILMLFYPSPQIVEWQLGG